MNKERIKSFILILLILNSIQLTGQMLFDKNLWHNGYGFLDSVKNSALVNTITSIFDKGSHNLTGEQLYAKTMKPRRIVVNGGGAREVYLKESDYYNDAMQFVDIVIGDLRESDITVSEITYDDWKNLFKTKSLYVDYGYTMDADNLNKLYGMKGSSGKFKQALDFSGFILTPDTLTNSCTICMLDETNNIIIEHKFTTDTSSLLKFIEDCTYQKQQNDAFAFEINLDTSTIANDEVTRNVSFSPLALLTIPTEIERETVLEAKEVFENSEEFEAFAERALVIFGHNASSLRKTVQSDETITFVENNATIKFYFDGTIEYNAVSRENGLKISSDVKCHQAVCDVLNIAGAIWKESDIDAKNLDFQLISDLIDNKNNKYTVKIDNIYNGIAINFQNICNNAITAEVEEGYITKLVIHLSRISETEQKKENAPVHMAIDSLYADYGNSGMIIEDVYKCYDFDKKGKAYVKWVFEVKGDEDILVIDSSDMF